MATQALPDKPRLDSGCSIFDSAHGLIVRSVAGAFRVEPVHRSAMERILAALDGTQDIEQLLGGETPRDAFYALRLLATFNETGLLGDGPDEAPPRQIPHGNLRLDGVSLTMLGGGIVARALFDALALIGARVQYGDLDAACASASIAIAAPDAPDLASLESTNRATRAVGASWLFILPFGDGIVTGPLFAPLSGPCFRCFELRWLGISSTTALELAYFGHLRRGGFHNEAIRDAGVALSLAPLLAQLVAARVQDSAAAPMATLIRPHMGTAAHTLLEPSPQCEHCATAGAVQRGAEVNWSDLPLPLTEVAASLADVIGAPCGLASIVPFPNGESAHPQRPTVALARFALPDAEEVSGAQDNWCHGAAANAVDASTLAVVEALERYNGLARPAPGLWARHTSVAEDALIPTELPLFSDLQYAIPGFPFRPFDPDMTLRWNWGYDLTQKRSVLVPTSAVWYGYDDALLGESSNGVAAHSSRGHALLNGVLELVERDAFMLHWLHRLSPPHVDRTFIDERTADLVAAVEESSYVVHLLDLTTDLDIPVALAIGVHEQRRKPALIVGAGASLDPDAALAHAARELYAATLSPTGLWMLKPPLALRDVRALSDHSRAYSHPEWLQHAAFLWSADRRVDWRARGRPRERDWRNDLASLIGRLSEHGHRVIGVDMTSPDVRRHRMHVVRAIVPGLQPLALAAGARRGGRRLYEAPARMGYRRDAAVEAELNDVPHCFP